MQRPECMLVSQLCLTLCDPMDCSPPGSSVHGISRQDYWSGLPFPILGNLPNPGIEPRSPALQTDSLPAEPQRKPTGSVVRLMGPRPWAQCFQCTGLVSLQHVDSLDQGSNLCPLHWQVDSYPLHITREVPHLHQHSTKFVTSFRKWMCII